MSVLTALRFDAERTEPTSRIEGLCGSVPFDYGQLDHFSSAVLSSYESRDHEALTDSPAPPVTTDIHPEENRFMPDSLARLESQANNANELPSEKRSEHHLASVASGAEASHPPTLR